MKKSVHLPANTHSTSQTALRLGAAAVAVSLMVQCRPEASGSDNSGNTENTENYHADNDIAMTVRSITDAISVGEPLDTAEYNFRGVLTDGEGAPLYTDVQGSPGQWIVDVASPGKAVIRNLYLGDLLPDDLREYIADNLDLGEDAVVENKEFDDDHEAEMTVYRFNGGTLRFEQRAGIASNGLEGPLVSIIIEDN